MAESFNSLQKSHESLLQKQQNVTEENQQDFTKEVWDYIERAKQAGSNIPSTRERDQVRANLRCWGNYIYSIDKTFPDTELAPSAVTNKRPLLNMFALFAVVALILFGVFQMFGSGYSMSPPTETPVGVQTTSTVQVTEEIFTPGIPVTAPSATPAFGGSDVVFTSPENGDSVLPKIVFRGAFTNLKPEASIHILLIKGDRVYAVIDAAMKLSGATTGEWELPAALYLKPDDLETPETLVVVPASCIDQSCRDTLSRSARDGIAIDDLPSQLVFRLYTDSSRVVYRNAYRAIQETRLLYSRFDGTSYDLFTSALDGTDEISITKTPDLSEMFPSLSPDGTKIVYIKRFHRDASDAYTYAISIMDSNGENDYEVIDGTSNLLESTQWSTDSRYIAYVVGDTSQSVTSYSLHAYNLSTKEEKAIPADARRRDNYRYYAWLPNSTNIVFNVGMGGSSGFVSMDVETMQPAMEFFNEPGEDFQPSLHLSESGYLLAFIVNNETGTRHDIHMAVDPDGAPPFNGTSLALIKSTGEDINYPILDPATNALYYTKFGAIYRAEYQVTNGTVSLKINPNIRPSGVLVVPSTAIGDKVESIFFDVGFMEAYFPLQ